VSREIRLRIAFNSEDLPITSFFFFGNTKIWAQGFILARQVLYSLSHASSPFVLVILEIGAHFLSRLAWILLFLLYISHHYWHEMQGPLHLVFFHFNGFSQTFFCQVWLGTTILLISVSCIVWDKRHVSLCPALAEVRSCKCLPGLASNHNPPNLSLLSS
jgi:hypothetical protein